MELATTALSFVLAVATAAAQPVASSEVAFIEAVQLAQRGSAGDAGAVDGAISAFEALVRAEPEQPLYTAYLGSAIATKGRDAWMPWAKIRYAEQGLDKIDRALAMLKPGHDRQLVRGAPAGIETRIVAARTFLGVPDSIFHRRAAGRRLAAEVLGHPGFAGSPAPLRAAAHLAAAQAARGERPEEELAQLKQVLSLVQSGVTAEQARARLKELAQ